MTPKRISDCTLAGTAEEITSDVMIPESRIPSTPERGSESSSGDMSTEWNIDEQDELFANVFCGAWTEPQTVENVTTSELTLGETQESFCFLKKYPQTPVLYQLFTKVFVNSLTMNFATDDFVKLDWNLMGSNNPDFVEDDPLTDKTPVYNDALTTKSFLTTSGFFKIGDSLETFTAVRQLPSMTININNNLEKTPALFEMKAIEQSLGDFVIDGSFDCYNVDDLGKSIYNDAVAGKDKIIQVNVSREVGTTTTEYTLTLPVHLSAPAESKNGNKLQFNVPFTVNSKDKLKLVKTVTITV